VLDGSGYQIVSKVSLLSITTRLVEPDVLSAGIGAASGAVGCAATSAGGAEALGMSQNAENEQSVRRSTDEEGCNEGTCRRHAQQEVGRRCRPMRSQSPRGRHSLQQVQQ
jgi:hypothetical protein